MKRSDFWLLVGPTWLVSSQVSTGTASHVAFGLWIYSILSAGVALWRETR